MCWRKILEFYFYKEENVDYLCDLYINLIIRILI